MITVDNIKEHHKDFELRPSLLEANKFFGSKPLVICEIGNDVGNNALSMCLHLDILELHLVDSFSRDKYSPPYLPYGECKERLHKWKNKVSYHIGKSADRVVDFTDGYFDLVYVDGDHTYEGCKIDMGLYWPKVKDKGVMAGHDWNMTSVQKAVTEYCEANNLKLFFSGMDWWIFKE